MSHLSEIRTEIRDLEALKAAALELGVDVLPWAGVYSYYAPAGQTGHCTPCDLVLGKTEWKAVYGTYGYAVGFKHDPETGVYRVCADVWGVVHENRGIEFMEKLGPGFSQFRTVCEPGRGNVHYATGRPTHLLREYAIQCGLSVARQYGMSTERTKNEWGHDVLVMEGGYIPRGARMCVSADSEGNSKVWVEGGMDDSCHSWTEPLEDAMGMKLGGQDLLAQANLYHARVGGELIHA